MVEGQRELKHFPAVVFLRMIKYTMDQPIPNLLYTEEGPFHAEGTITFWEDGELVYKCTHGGIGRVPSGKVKALTDRRWKINKLHRRHC